MNKPITPKKFVSDVFGMMEMMVEEAVAAEREACAKLLESRKTGANELMDAVRDMEAKAIRARGEQA
jgi:hypothetical protein